MQRRDEFLDKACSGICDRRTRLGVREELSSHIDDKAEDYVLYGCSPEEAEDKAISDMGDATKLMRELAEVHSFFPVKRFKNSLVLFAVGFIMVSLYIDVGIFDEVCAVVSNMAMLVACFNLAGCNRLLFAAFALSVAGYAAMTAGWAISSFPYSAEGAALNVAVIIVGVIISCIRMYVFGYGIAQFSQGKAAERARRIGWIYLFACALICVTCFVPDIIWLTFAALVVVVIVIAFAILSVRGDVWRNDREVAVARRGVRSVALLCAFVVLLAAVAPSVRGAFNCRQPRTENFVVCDLSGEEAERAEEARALVAGQFYGIEFVDELIADVSDKIAQSHLLRLCGDDVVVGKGEMRTALGWQCVTLFFYHLDGEEAERVNVLSLYRYLDEAQFRGVCQAAYAVGGSAIANSASVPAVFVDLCSVGGRVLRIENNYEYFSSERIGVENSFIDGSSDRSGYALFDVGLNGAEGFYFTEQRYVNSRILRRPQNREIIEDGQTDEGGWRMLNGYGNGVAVPERG